MACGLRFHVRILRCGYCFAQTALLKLHAAGYRLLWLVTEASVPAALFSLFNYIRKHGDD